MTMITVVAKIIPDEQAEAILLDAMRSATKVYNGLIWQLREQYEQNGKAPISRTNLNRLMTLLPRAKESYSPSAQATRDEVIEVSEAYTSQRCHPCGKVSQVNRRQRGWYACASGRRMQADVNAAANVSERFAHVSPLKRSSGCVASPVVMPLRCSWHTVCEPGSS
jgi:transposase